MWAEEEVRLRKRWGRGRGGEEEEVWPKEEVGPEEEDGKSIMIPTMLAPQHYHFSEPVGAD